MKTLTTAIVLALVSGLAHANQTFRCRGADNLAVTIQLTNEDGSIDQVKAKSKVDGFWRSGSGSGDYGVGTESSIKSSNLGEQYQDQVEGKPAVTVWTEEKNNSSILYHFTFSKELLGERFQDRKVNGWIDPDAPEGGGYPLDLKCSSTGSR